MLTSIPALKGLNSLGEIAGPHIAGVIKASGLPVEAVNEIFTVTLDHEIFGSAIRKVNISVTVLVLRGRAASRNP